MTKILRFLVTGGCGSIGSALVERLLIKGHTVCSLDNNESQLFHQIQILSKRFPNTYRPFLGDVRDYDRLHRAFSSVDIVFHCAALKHVELSEYNPFEVLKTNIEGTHNVVEACLNTNVKKLVFASSDKAVNPSSTMGASKLLAERIIISSSSYVGTSSFISSCVRFGNVWDTAGSVGKIFKKQALDNMPITLTSSEMTRFFITIEKALDLFEYALNSMKGGEIFVSSMGVLSINKLANAFKTYFQSESEISIIGAKPGEKLFEELYTEQESPRTNFQDGYYIINKYGNKNILNKDIPLTLRSDDSNLTEIDPLSLIKLI